MQTSLTPPKTAPDPNRLDLSRIAQDLQIRKVQVENVVRLLDEGNTVPFITRYRKELTGGLDEEVIRIIQARVHQLRQLADRKQSILKSIEGQGKLTDELRDALQAAETPKRLEDLYLPYKPKKRTLASAAREKGLEPLALAIWSRDPAVANLAEILSTMINPELGLNTPEEVLLGVQHILAEQIAETADVRAPVRFYLWDHARLITSKSDKVKEGEGLDFKIYFQFTEPIRTVPPHRILAVNRGEKENVLSVRLEFDRQFVQNIAEDRLPPDEHPHADFLRQVTTDALDRLLLPSLEREIRRELTAAAEDHAVSVFARNLRNLLMAPPLRGRRILAIDPGFKSGCKLAALDEFGNPLEHALIYLNRKDDSRRKVEELIRRHQTTVIAIGNGTGCRETEEMVSRVITDIESRRGKGTEERSQESAESGVSGEQAAPPVPEAEVQAPTTPEPPAPVPAAEATQSEAAPAEQPLAAAEMPAPAPASEQTPAPEPAPTVQEGQPATTVEQQAPPPAPEQPPVPAQTENAEQPAVAPETAPAPEAAAPTAEGQTPPAAEGVSPAPAEGQPAASEKPAKPEKPPKPPKVNPLIGLPEAPADLAYVIVNEAGASVYSASPVGREEFPEYDATLRGTISIGRRLQDPLSELVKIDPQHVGVGLYQHDINAKHLKETLEGVIESCVNTVGVDLNTASVPLLRYVSGLNQLVAHDLVEHRKQNGPFRSREQLLSVQGIGDARFTQAAGFLKIDGGDEPLDQTWIHPESYGVARQLLGDLGYGAEALADREKTAELCERLKGIPPEEVSQRLGVGLPTLKDIVEALGRPGRDPREDVPPPVFKKEVLKLEDLHAGMELKGTVLNVVDFGAFVDIGLKDSGLVHISQMANRYVKSPYDVVAVGDVVHVWVLSVDPGQRRVSLTMIRPGTERRPQERRPPRGEGRGEGRGAPQGEGQGAGQPQERGPGRGPGHGPGRGPGRGQGAPHGQGQGQRQEQGHGQGPPPGRRLPPRGTRRTADGGLQKVGAGPVKPAEGTPGAGEGGEGGQAPAEAGAHRPQQTPGRKSRRQPPRPQLSQAALSGKASLGTFAELAAYWEASKHQEDQGEPPPAGEGTQGQAPEGEKPPEQQG
jgi:protein Tex